MGEERDRYIGRKKENTRNYVKGRSKRRIKNGKGGGRGEDRGEGMGIGK